jgi:hypothetical protein
MANDITTAKLELTRLQQAYNTAKATQAPKGNTSAAQVKRALNAFKAAQTEVKNLESASTQAATDKAAKAKAEKEAADIKAGKVTVTQAMQEAGIDKDILKEMQALGLPISPEAFSASGVGSTTLVYLGTKQGVVGPAGAKKLTLGQKPNVATTNSVYNQFWDDAATKAKVKSAMINAGMSNVNDISAFEQWKQIVNTSAQVYAAGKGPKMTPMDVLNQVMSTGGEENIPRKTVQQVDPLVKNAIVRTIYQNVLGRNETASELAESLKAVDKLISSGTITTTKRIGGKDVTVSTPGFSEAAVAESITKSIEGRTEGPVAQDLKEKQSLDFMNFLSKMKG